MSAAGTKGWGRVGVVAVLVAVMGIVSTAPVQARAAMVRVDEEMAVGVGVMAMAAVAGGLPMGIPPAEPDPMMTRILPEKCYLYVSWQGTARPDPASPNQTEALLAEPEVQQFLADVERAIREAVKQEGRPPRPGQPNPEDLIAAFKTLLTRPATFYVADFRPSRQGVTIDAGIVVNVGDQGEVFERLLSTIGARRKAPDRGKAVPEMKRPAFKIPDVKTESTPAEKKRERPTAIQTGEKEDDPNGYPAAVDGVSNTYLIGQKYLDPEKYRTGPGGWRTLDLGPGGPPVQWAVKGEHLIVGIGEGVADAILARAETPPPAWVAELHRKLGMDRPANILHVNDLPGLIQTVATGEPEVYQVMRALGLSDVQSITSATGLDEKGCVTRLLIALDREPRGVLSVFNAKPLTKKDLEVIPRDATIAAALRFDLADAFDTFLDVVGRIEPRAEREILGGMGEAERELGFSFRRDLFAALGDTWRVYNSPGDGGLIFTGATAVVNVRDADRLRDVNKRLIEIMRREMGPRSRDYGPPGRPYYSRRRGATIEEFKHQGHTVYFLNVIGEEMPVAPAWCITDDELVAALFPQQVKAYLDRKASGSAGDSLDKVPEVAGLFAEGEGPLGLVYVDTPELFELGYPVLQILAQMGCSELQAHGINVNASMLPSAPSIARHLRPDVVAVRRTEAGILVESHRTVAIGGVGAAAILALPAYVVTGRGGPMTAARENISRNNLKQIGLALHNYHTVHNRLPGNIYSKDGKPLLSWRVQILPYIEQQALYDQFHLDEPWDSPHNRRLAETMVSVYRIPGSDLPPGQTTYLGVAGKDGLFAGKEGTRFEQVTDGTSNTIMVVQAADSKAVPWSKPADFDYDEDNPIAGLVNPWDYRFNALMGDGSVHSVPETISARTLKALFTKSGGEIVDTSELYGPPRPRAGVKVYEKPLSRRPERLAPYRGEKVEPRERGNEEPKAEGFDVKGPPTRPAPRNTP